MPLTIEEAQIDILCAVSQRLAMVTMQLTVVNDSVSKPIEAALRFPLPDSDATVCGYKLGANSAIAVPKAKAAVAAGSMDPPLSALLPL